MFTAPSLDLLRLPFVRLANLSLLPAVSAVYFAIQDDGKVLYIGQSKNLATRWREHHRKAKLQRLTKVRIAWFQVDESRLIDVEKQCIEYFKPEYNGRDTKAKPTKPYPVTFAEDELSLIDLASKKLGLPRSTYARQAAIRQARKDIRDAKK